MNLISLFILTSCSLSLLCFCVCYNHPSKDRTLILNKVLTLSSPRRKRSLLLPNYGSIKLTFGLAKGLIGSTPKGLTLSYELCSYFVGPTVIKDFLNEITQTKPKQQVIDRPIKMNNSKIWHKSALQKYQHFSNDYFSKVNGISFKHHYPFNDLRRNSKYGHVVFPRSSSNFEPDMVNVRNKSPLRKALDHIIGPNGRCNILKPIICKSKTILLPPGYSMIQDIVRIIILPLTKDLSPKGEDFNFCEDKLFPDCII